MIDSNALKGPLGRSLISAGVIVLFGCLLLFNIASPIFNTSQDVKETQTDSLIAKHTQYVAMDIARFNGRSAFFKPIRKPKPTTKRESMPKPPEDVPNKIVDPLPPQPDRDYLGPPLIAIIGNEAWFRGSGSGMDSVIRIKIGEEENGITLVGTQEPATATVKYRRGEYEIDLFAHEEPFFTVDAPELLTPDFLEEVDESLEESPTP